MWKGLSDKVIKVIESTADDQCIMRDSFYTTCMWANISTGKEYFHKTHSHPNSFFSSIIYLRGNESSKTIFHDPRPQTTILMPDYSQSNRYNTTAFRLPFEEGFIAIFPAWLTQDVLSEGNDNSNRITLTCNTMMHFESTTKTTYLKI